jgi:hypothetical protein
VASKYIPALAETGPAVVEDEDPVITRRLKGIIAAMLEGKLDASVFTEQSRKAGFPAKVQEVGKSMASLGALREFGRLPMETKDGLPVHRYRAVLGATPLRVSFTLAADGKIAGLLVVPE